MAFLANQTYDGPGEHPGIGRTVRLVARHAAFGFHRRMLVDEWPPHIAVAFQAARFIRPDGLQRTWLEFSVRIVAIDAGHRTLRKTVGKRLLETGPDILVAGSALLIDVGSPARH